MIDITEIEKKINVDKFIYKNENLWPIFRDVIGGHLRSITTSSPKTKKNIFRRKQLNIILSFFINFLKFFNFLRSYDVILFTCDANYKKMHDKSINRFTGPIINKFQNFKFLEVQHANSNVFLKKDENNTNITYASRSHLIVVTFIISFFIFLSSDLKNLINQLKVLKLNINYKRVLKWHLSQQKVYRILFKIISPKHMVFTSHTYINEMYCANKLGIKTIEFQHGVIINNYAYNIQRDINNLFYPKNIYVFGEFDKDYLVQKKYVLEEKNITILGNYILEYYNSKSNLKIKNLKKNYKYIIGVSTQLQVLDELIEFIINSSIFLNDIFFILIPRSKGELKKYELKYKNILVETEINIYEILSNVDFHLTCYSYCAFEAPALGTPNIFWNHNNLSNIYFYDYILKNPGFNQLISNKEELINYLEDNTIDKVKIKNQNDYYISSSYNKNLSKNLIF